MNRDSELMESVVSQTKLPILKNIVDEHLTPKVTLATQVEKNTPPKVEIDAVIHSIDLYCKERNIETSIAVENAMNELIKKYKKEITL
ncbi:hypothetical protein KZO01_27490 [Kurthia zopfii]|uniref:Uncharacterized protein n=1 Tax=Kurthia zopfii TaxID=1650 RepID=A0A8B4Q3W7_9BACL|nr:hypothetical protein [Kurthia zopfii]PWI21793.1 hypothetical protein DF281_10215 [Kurthia zopfii]TDR37821.1 hypothetical protein DFR61_11959 [Kurthia zopfii]GEK32440.1 hypothetical protein KZO01_27490 [Kurthia zopfii]STX08497.1 Uncharacterised protein [Kurthia zopfii]